MRSDLSGHSHLGGGLMKTSECDVVIVGVGGQGVILISDVIGRAAVRAGKPVRGGAPARNLRGAELPSQPFSI